MDARFRIRTRSGEEFTPETMEVFSNLVRDGVVGPQDQVFDELTGEWAPASAHPMVKLFQDPLVEEAVGEDPGRADVQDPAEPPDPDTLELGLVEPELVSPEEEARAFIAKMEEERRSDPDVPAMSLEVPLVDAGADSLAARGGEPERVVAPPPERAPERPPERPPERAPEPEYPSPSYAASPVADTVETWTRPVASRPRWRRRQAPGRRTVGWGTAMVLGGVIGAVSVSVLWSQGAGWSASQEDVAQAEAGTSGPRVVPVTEEQTRALALSAFVRGVDALRDEYGIGTVPSMWLEGRYLADPRAHPEVRDYWERYLAFVEAARDSEVDLYRAAYLTAAEAAGLSGPVRSLRLAAAQEDFEDSWDGRATLYERVEGLARSALALDDLLREMEGRVTYEPIAGPRVSADPVIEAAGTDPDAQVRLEDALDHVLNALQGATGISAGDRAEVPGWLAEALRTTQAGASR